MPLQAELVSPERILFSGEADMVVCRTAGGGEVAFLAGHQPFLAALAEDSTVRIKKTAGGDESAEVGGGFVHVDGESVIILSDEADLSSDS